mmetsp:Transcript_20170/g.52336  ORF Transcript_20170/g.52336 Transcript_20170/m.52336 type:complete len:92 (-) Transcript_20170:399-674(-)
MGRAPLRWAQPPIWATILKRARRHKTKATLSNRSWAAAARSFLSFNLHTESSYERRPCGNEVGVYSGDVVVVVVLAFREARYLAIVVSILS